MGEMRNAYKILVGKPEGRRPLGRPRRIKMDLREVGIEGVNWTHLAQNRDRWLTLVKIVMNLWVQTYRYSLLKGITMTLLLLLLLLLIQTDIRRCDFCSQES
jgi:hypothetical protein